jgi:hypothetical protein
MPDLTAKRTLVKSPPELWEELSEVERLARHLGAFGEISITKLEPEHTVAWEGEHASGTVSIEPSGWGTKVTLRAELPEPDEPEPEPEPTVEAEPEPLAQEPEPIAQEPAAEPAAETSEKAPRRGFWGWLFRHRTGAVTRQPEPVTPQPEPVAVEPEPEPVAEEPQPVAKEPAPAPVAAEVAEEPVSPPVGAEAVADEAELDGAEQSALDPERARLILDEALDTLGAAHHRPFSRG